MLGKFRAGGFWKPNAFLECTPQRNTGGKTFPGNPKNQFEKKAKISSSVSLPPLPAQESYCALIGWADGEPLSFLKVRYRGGGHGAGGAGLVLCDPGPF